MEHKQLLGGEQHLPFARGRIKALRAAGLRFAAQRFVLPDATVTVRIVEDQDFIQIVGGGSCVLKMDSGMVNLFSVAPANPDRYLAGTLTEVGSAVAYNSAFVIGDNPWRENPGTTSAGQLSGIVSAGKRFAGAIYPSPASFAPGLRDVTPATDPPTTETDPEDGTLYAKKLTAVLCPPSVFTGKTRLYVQAMYGAPLYELNAAETSVRRTNTPLETSLGSAAPALVLPAYARADDAEPYAPVYLDTSCGVWLDTTTGKHWLYQPTGNSVYVYPLLSSSCGERMREYLIPTDGGLSSTDREHLEAYILAWCRPDVKNAQLADGTLSGAGTFSMGYGWHWNWSGDRADLVKNETFTQFDGNSAMRSTHYRLTVTKVPATPPEGGFAPGDVRQTWAAAVEVVSGPSDWMVARGSWCIAEPNYSSMELVKSTPRNSTRFEGSGTFYAFYDRDTLKTCSVAVTFQGPGSPERTISERFCGSSVYGANDITYTTLGTAGGFMEESLNNGTSYKAVFDIGGEVSQPLYEGYTRTGIRYEATEKTLVGYIFFSQDVFFSTSTIEYGYPDANGAYASVTYTRNSVTIYDGMFSYDVEITDFSELVAGGATVVVPFYDAEACYLQSNSVATRSAIGTSTRWNATVGGFDYVTKTVVNVYDPPTSSHDEEVFKYGWNQGAGTSGATSSGTTPLSRSTTTTTDDKEVLVCRAGALPATFSHLTTFHDNTADSVPAQFATKTATSADSPVAIAPGYIDAVGTGGSEGNVPVLVGWI